MSDRSIVIVSSKARKGAKFHRPACSVAEKMVFRKRTTVGKAKKDGFVACGKCKPN